ncbi:xylitol oxidase [Motilibacter peucedani]|uniref:Xylitol oxidase n=1 Tax=Motilibacter peucedani TaxID=598650 RepID=A0A420XQ66_9ACTN|nr:FAD-binding protein [Motilibacter peucedani]RKS75376.1 xylitol oxidase [Motilibacter peucedani]
MSEQNWAGNVTFSASEVVRPTTVAELQELVARSPRVRALGTGHSFSTVADTTGTLVSLAEMPATVEVDSEAQTVRVAAAVRFGEIAAALHEAGLALHNMGSLPHISVAGACATGTHGSGIGKGNLASAVVALEMVTADGSLVTLRKGDPDFPAAVVALGSLGIVTHLTLAVQPSFEVRQWVYDDLSFEQVLGSFDEVMGAGYSVSAFTDWNGDTFTTTWVKKRVGDEGDGDVPEAWLGGRLAPVQRHCIEGMPPENCTQQLGVPGPWHERLPHFRMEFTPSNGDEIQSEYLVAAENGPDALRAIHGVREQIAPVLQISEIRTIAADELWMSAAYGRDSVALHFTWISDAEAVAPALRALEEAIAPFEARPHWGKVFSVEPEDVRALFPRIEDFGKLTRTYDPGGKLRNAFVDTYLG